MGSDDIPDEVVVSNTRHTLRLSWTGGDALAFEAGALRAACRCAWCTRDKVLNCFAAPAGTIALDGVDALGSHGLHIKFSDGHARGIYPWAYLRALADPAPNLEQP